MAGERRTHKEIDSYRPNYRNTTVAKRTSTSSSKHPNVDTRTQSETSFLHFPPPKVRIDLKAAVTKSKSYKLPDAADQVATTLPKSRRKSPVDITSSPVTTEPKTTRETRPSYSHRQEPPITPTTNDQNLAIDQSETSRPSDIRDYSEEMKSLASAPPPPKSPNCKSSPPLSSNYSPPSPPKREASKASISAVVKVEETNDPDSRKGSFEARVSHSPARHYRIKTPMMIAPWNDHQSEIGDQGVSSSSGYEVQLSDSEDDHPVRSIGENSLLPESIDKCDNHGCNAFHSHFDCPLGMKCWGCRAKTHYTSACPMTCVECGFEGHSRKYCKDFEIDPVEGIAHPKRPSVKPASADTILPSLPPDRIYECDNYPCREMHSHFNCPLPTVCWGCRAIDHFWSGCHARCDKCGAQRHISKYCDEFESWINGQSRPKRTPEERRIIAMKRQREIESHQSENENHHSQSLNGSTYPTPRSVDYSASLQPPSKRHASSTRRPSDRLTPTEPHPQKNVASLRAQSQQTPRSPATPSQPRLTRDTSPSIEYGPNGEKIYCTYWLRTGHCAFADTPRGCSLKHQVPPNAQTQRGIGIAFNVPWLQHDPVVKEYYRLHQSSRPTDRNSVNKVQQELYRLPLLTGSRVWVRESPKPKKHVKNPATTLASALRESSQRPAKEDQTAKQSVHSFLQSLGPISNIKVALPEPTKSLLPKYKPAVLAEQPRMPDSESGHFKLQVPTASQNKAPSRAAIPTAPRGTLTQNETPPREIDHDHMETRANQETLPQQNFAATSAIQVPPATSASPILSISKTTPSDSRAAKLAAFEEEEYFRQKRHEAEMARKAEQLRLDYEHEKRMAELRRGT